MARSFSSASSQRLTVGTSPMTTVPLTMSCWYYCTDTTTLQTVLELSKAGAGVGVHKYRLILRGDLAGASKTLQAQQNPGNVVSSTIAYTGSTWQHACGVFTTTASRTVYLNGANNATDTTAGSPASVDQTSLAVAWDGSGAGVWTQYYTGRIAEVGVWNVAITAAEVASLAKGYSPLEIRPASLVAYYPLGGHYGQFDLDRWKNRYDLTAYNSPTWSDHPRVIYPGPSFAPIKKTVATGNRRRRVLIGAGT